MALRLTARCFRCHLRQHRRLSQHFQSQYSTTSSNQDNDYADIVISGGGMVGGSMACALGNNKMLKNKRIVLLEASKDKGDYVLPNSYSNRTCALSPSTRRLLESFGAWQEIEALRYHPVLRMQVWESCSDSLITFNNPDMTDSLAYIVENDVILAGIMRALKAQGNRVEIRYGTKVETFSLPGKEEDNIKLPYVGLQLSDGSELRTKLLIGADGMNSAVRDAAGFHTMTRDYKQTAVVATLVLGDTTLNNTAWQRFLPTGPIALLPLSDKLSSLVWTTTPQDAKHLQQIPADSFVDAVNDALWHEREKNPLAGQMLEAFKTVVQNVFPDSDPSRQLPPTVIDVQEGSRAAFPLKLIHSSQYVQSRVALIGDAGHRLHPLAGQGVNLGFGDVECLNEVLGEAVRSGADPGSLTPLLRYESERQRHNVPVMLSIDGLQRLYSTEFTPLVVLRSLGLQATNSLSFIKKKIIEQASI
ncbi:ubiquinone biosynthesis monooxygenase COQ6, mitochondrial [Aplysia californica]|uniref:Ubiquinone biosynthesis monooxygenase COQ6, mitochondrial n=1 Tax=Aplysia californica TaxID=6500 RepID=A0ABM0K911_APLCA|nr:ubiquinone biosynthesis monooxygenase COQ6, mitochondrial [Aplysia californica]